MSFETVTFAWKNGERVKWSDANVHLSAHALHYGSGVFEGIRCYETVKGPHVFRLDAHLERLRASAAVYDIEIPYSNDALARATYDLIEGNGFTSCYIRPIAFRGSGNLGLHPAKCPVETAILAWPWGAYLGNEGIDNGIRLTVSPWRKFHSSMMPTTAKACGQYLNSILAVQDAVSRGFDEALLLDIDGRLAEGSGENLFLIRDGTVYTNKAEDSILLGITRDSVITIAQDCGYMVRSQALGLDDLLAADEAFLTGTAAEITPIQEIDGHRIGGGRPGPITCRLQQEFFQIVEGRNNNYASWLHNVAAANS